MGINFTAKIRQEKLYLLLFLGLLLFSEFVSRFPEWVEAYYSQGFYLLYARWMRWVFGGLPFSFGDGVYIGLSLLAVFWFFVNFKHIFQKPRWFFGILLRLITVLYGVFLFSWGLNYHRLPLYKSLQIETKYTNAELENTLKYLIEKSNALHAQLAKNDSAMLVSPIDKAQIISESTAGFEALSLTYPKLKLYSQSLKTSVYSIPLTYMGFSGYFNPLTHEAQVDGIMPLEKFYITALHEQAHQLGYAAEEEANFVGWLAAVKHPDKVFNYYGYVFALRYVLNEWYLRSPENYQGYLKQVKPGILAYFKASADFWKQYENPFEPIFKTTFNAYLKANKQTKGIESYNYVTGLIVGYLKGEKQ